ncbi:hypothetical protein DP091_15690 [Paenibacillus sp. MDMC362]|nr:hypothetical protein DP091_15690 [Paenibacillus sp. MDMC362]
MHAGFIYGAYLGRNLRAAHAIYVLVRTRGFGTGGGLIVTIILICTLFIFLYLIYALIHPEKF